MASRALMLFLLLGLTSYCSAAVLKVGDHKGWTILGNVNYSAWASTKKFQVGDIIVFEYNKDYHNVMLVTKNDYKSCNATKPIATYDSGNDSIPITRAGHNFFICGFPGHCAAGQKVNIRVEKTIKPSPSPRSAPVPESGSSSSGSSTNTGDESSIGSTTDAPAPKPSSGPRFLPVHLVLGVSVLATMASLVV